MLRAVQSASGLSSREAGAGQRRGKGGQCLRD